MSDYYRPRRTRGLYNPTSKTPFKISRSKIDLFLECSRCFYIDRRLGVGRPPGYPFNLNSAVDALLKKEFDVHRAAGSAHPLMKSYGIDAVPFAHKDIDTWRENFVGVQVLHSATNLLVFGAVDDVWQNPAGELSVVDYKATSKDGEVSLDAPWQIGYKRQMEVYQWLLRGNDHSVSDTGYFVYANGKRDREAFDGTLEFDVVVLPYIGDGSWIEGTLRDIKICLDAEVTPQADEACDYCRYRRAVSDVLAVSEQSAPEDGAPEQATIF